MSVISLPTLFTITTAPVGYCTLIGAKNTKNGTGYLGEAIDLKMFFHSGWSS
ncbi:hypothetical protein MSP8887_04207 [Marinomonas spartinae]|uniref:hypothetical protein n=1 Tax=Marinomonas spartinae TaxID=1792290 RepID=UPI000808CCB3|nr:hypothetical protein [Marinomonas spartinae]SBS40142.1 hypothetical protein MSP8887_04207 [Marinomonas spartinae]